MDKVSKTLRDHYAKTFRAHGRTSEGVDWGKDGARVSFRYAKMLDLVQAGKARKPSLLDVGCGYGGLLQYAKEKAVPLSYTGIDVVHGMVLDARAHHPDGAFITGDVLEAKLGRRFDYVVCNGILTQKLDLPGLLMDEFAARLIRRMFALCRKGIAFNVMTTKVNFFANNLYYRNPAEMLSWCMNEITPILRVDHSYPFFEYTMYLYKDPS